MHPSIIAVPLMIGSPVVAHETPAAGSGTSHRPASDGTGITAELTQVDFRRLVRAIMVPGRKEGLSPVGVSLNQWGSFWPTQQWERNVYAVTLAVFVAFSGFTVVMPFLPLYVHELGVGDPRSVALWSGLVFGISPFIAGMLAPVWGAIADRYGRKPVFLRSLIAFVILMVLYGLAQNVWQLFGLRVLHGVFGGFGAMAISMVSVSAPEDRAGAAIGRLQAAMLLTNASGPLAGGVLASTVGIRATFYISAVICALALLTVIVFYREERWLRQEARRRERLPWRSMLLLPALLPLVGVLFLSQFVDRSLSPVLPLYVQELGTRPSAVALYAGVLTSAGALASAAAAAGVGRLTNRYPLFRLL
ncbi:MAG: MFS transporter, partial [Chloroflexota bacterium]|nr:MFS transporter [Chloroflexota bacterium]